MIIQLHSNTPEVLTESLAHSVEYVRQSINERNNSKDHTSSCTHVDVVIIQYSQGCPKQTQQYYGFRYIVVRLLVWLHKAYNCKTDCYQDTVN